MRTVTLTETSEEDKACVNRISQHACVDIHDCYQCGKCSAGCPMADAMDVPPQQIMRLLQLGLVDQVLDAKSPWICAQCMTCSSRCPRKIDTAAIMREVRRESHEAGRHARSESNVFESLFIKGIRSKGRSNEQYLAAQFNMTSGHFIQDALKAPKMFSKNMIGLQTQQSENPEAIARLIDACTKPREDDDR